MPVDALHWQEKSMAFTAIQAERGALQGGRERFFHAG
jgi:hypothetical protein